MTAPPSPGPSGRQSITLAGYPRIPIGVGEHMRCSFRSLRAADIECRIADVYDTEIYHHQRVRDDPLEREIGRWMTDAPTGDIVLFHINGPDLPNVLSYMKARALPPGYNIVLPWWELSKYPDEWVSHLEKFDEIWTGSSFVYDCISAATKTPVYYMPMAVEVSDECIYRKEYFNIPENKYIFLFLYDSASYVQRKNPDGVLNAFRRFLQLHPDLDADLVIKVNNAGLGAGGAAEWERFLSLVSGFEGRVHIVDRVCTGREMEDLLRCCDCFLSLHRSEGFGRGLAEAMSLGKPVIATAYSGNMDFTRPDNSLLVDYRLIPVASGAYPFGQGQVWASPDVEQAAQYMARLAGNPGLGQEIGGKARHYMRSNYSYGAIGAKLRRAFERIGLGVR